MKLLKLLSEAVMVVRVVVARTEIAMLVKRNGLCLHGVIPAEVVPAEVVLSVDSVKPERVQALQVQEDSQVV